MRVSEILTEDKEDKQDLSALADACERWIALEHYPEDIQLILSHPYSQQFKRPLSSTVYRSVFYPYSKFEKTGKAKVRGQPEGFIAYTYKPDWGGAQAREDFDYDGDIIKFKKQLNPQDVLLNFTELVKSLKKDGYDTYAPDESEVWIKTTPYYTTFDKSEFVDVDMGQ